MRWRGTRTMERLTTTPLKSLQSSRNLFEPLIPSVPSLPSPFFPHFRSQHPPPDTVRMKYAPSAPRDTKLGASAPLAFHVVFHASCVSNRPKTAFSKGGGKLLHDADVLSHA